MKERYRNAAERHEDTEEKLVVYIEDEPEMIDMARIVLESYGYHLLGAIGGKQGIEIVKKVKPDAVLLDLLMPELDGWKVYRELKWDDETADIPVIVITAKEQPEEVIKKQFPQGVAAYIVKPFGPYEIVRELERIFFPDRAPVKEKPAHGIATKPYGERIKELSTTETPTEREEETVENAAIPSKVPSEGESAQVRTRESSRARGSSVHRQRGHSGMVVAIKRTISAIVAAVLFLRYAASFISSSFKDKT
jgi:two-component system response regulator VicR